MRRSARSAPRAHSYRRRETLDPPKPRRRRERALANDAPVLAQHGEQQQHAYNTVPAWLQHTTLKLVLQREDEEQEQHEQIADGVEGTPGGSAQQHGGSSSAHGRQLVGDGAAGLYEPSRRGVVGQLTNSTGPGFRVPGVGFVTEIS